VRFFCSRLPQFEWEAHVMQCKDAVEQAVAELARAKLLLQKQEQQLQQHDQQHQQQGDDK